MLGEQDTLRTFLADVAASVRRVYRGPISYSALPFERIDWEHFDVIGVNYYRQSRQCVTDDQYLAKIRDLQATAKPVMITEFGFASCRDADNPEYLGSSNATPLSLLPAHLPVIRLPVRARVRTVHTRDEQDPRHDIDATALSIVRALAHGRRGTTYPRWPGNRKRPSTQSRTTTPPS